VAQNLAMDITMNTPSPSAEPPRSQSPSPVFDPAAQVTPKRIYRDPSGPIGGVAGGFAAYFDVDPVIARLLWLMALFSGIGLPAYLICWLVIPKAKVWPVPGYGGPTSGAGGQGSAALLSGLIIIGLVAVIGNGLDGIGDYLLPAALIGVGVYLLTQRSDGDARAGAPSVHGSAPLGGAAIDEAGLVVGAGAAEAEPASRAPASAASSAPAGLVTPTVLSVLAIAAGVVAALHAAGLVDVSIATLAAGGLVIVGAGLLASLWLGRARGLVPLGLGLFMVMLVAASVEPWFAGDESSRVRVASNWVDPTSSRTMGDRRYAPASLAELQPSYELGMGELTLDLSRVDFSGQARTLKVNVGMGEVTVIVPPGTSVKVRGHVGIGEASALGRSDDGMGVDVEEQDDGFGAGQLEIEYNVGMGNAEVRRAGL
jgi:phage shock protein PspC (stress-responsive transcriptional regulator)